MSAARPSLEPRFPGIASYSWDFENRLASVTLPGSGGTVSFKYDPFGRRIEKTTPNGTTVYIYDGDNVIEELDGSGNVTAKFTQGLGIDEPLAMYQAGASYYYEAGSHGQCFPDRGLLRYGFR